MIKTKEFLEKTKNIILDMSSIIDLKKIAKIEKRTKNKEMVVTIFSDRKLKNSFYEAKVTQIEQIQSDVYKKTIRFYTNYGVYRTNCDFSISDIEYMFKENKEKYKEIYVNSKNRIIDYVPEKNISREVQNKGLK